MFYIRPLNFCCCFYLLIRLLCLIVVGFFSSFSINFSFLLRLSRRFIHSTLAATDCSTLAVCMLLLLLLLLLASYLLAFLIAVIIIIVIMTMDLVKSAAQLHGASSERECYVIKYTNCFSFFLLYVLLFCEINFVYLFTPNT